MIKAPDNVKKESHDADTGETGTTRDKFESDDQQIIDSVGQSQD